MSNAGFIAVIPARYGSSRLPGKPLKDIAGKPMIEWVYRQTLGSGASEVIVRPTTSASPRRAARSVRRSSSRRPCTRAARTGSPSSRGASSGTTSRSS